MKIRNIRSFIKDLRLTKPYTIAHYHFDSVSMVFVELELENGIVGYGTASPAEEVVGETSAQTLNNLQSNITQQLIGKSIDDYQSIIKHFHQLWPNYPGSVAAIDIALHDAYGKYIGKSVASILGQQINGLPTSVTIGIKSVIETIEEARAYLQLGFHVVKLKTGMSIEEDIEKVIRLKEIFHDKIHIRVDANQGYNLQQLQQFMNATKDCKLDLIEQPAYNRRCFTMYITPFYKKDAYSR
jgi:L-alanine-DL-glutamate epimerase-like enolase superfamily enzyme